MGRSLGRLGAVVSLAIWLAACSGSSSKKDDKTPPDRVCEPGSKSCDGQNVKVCNDNGTERTIEKTCGPSQTCADGDCAETSCVPNTKFCQAGDVWKCDSTGSGRVISQKCTSSQFCREEDDTARCSDQACTPTELLCDGDVATSCLEDGSGPSPEGIDCAENGQICVDGQCEDTTCTPGAKVCKNDDVYLCAKNGSDLSLLAECQTGTVCDGEKLACVPKVCEIAASGCDGTRTVKCNAYGSAWDPTGTDCAAENKVCVSGACKKQTCTPNSTFCQTGDVYQCDQNGVGSSLWQACRTPYYHCAPYPSANYASCEYNQCQPDQVLCDGNVVRKCNSDGSWPSEGTDCGADEFCESGQCKTHVCEPGTIYCKEGDVYGCDWQGASSSLYQQCPADTMCKVAVDSYACIPLPCSPGETVCLGNQIGVCDAEGQELASVTDDCAKAGTICGTDNKCAKSVVDILGDDEGEGDDISESSSYFIGDVVEVRSARQLTAMELNLSLPPTRSLRWVIFEQSNDFTFVSKKDWVVSGQSGSGYFSSGAISYPLKAGKTYLFGAVITGGNTFTAYLDTGPFAVNSSFGTVLGRVETPYSPTLSAWVDTGYLYQMKITTAP